LLKINGEAILVFRAENDDAAQRIIREEDSGRQPVVRGCSGLLRADGRPLWDGTSMKGDETAAGAFNEIAEPPHFLVPEDARGVPSFARAFVHRREDAVQEV
jgi:hypothetical protein